MTFGNGIARVFAWSRSTECARKITNLSLNIEKILTKVSDGAKMNEKSCTLIIKYTKTYKVTTRKGLIP